MTVRDVASYLAVCALVLLHPCFGAAQSDVPRAIAVAREAVVVVRCGDARVGTAFAWGASDRVVTTWQIADCPRQLGVETTDGRRVLVRVAASDDEHDLAVLVGDGLVLTPPTERRDPVEIGTPVLAVGFGGGPDGLVIDAGAIASVSPDVLRTDAAYPGATGGPVLDGDGHVVGMVATTYESAITRVVPVHWLAVLADETPPAGDVRAPARFRIGIDTGVLVLDQRALFAAEASLSIELWDELSLRVALQTAGGNTTEWAPQPVQRGESLIAGAATLGYRFRIQADDAFALTIVPEIGAWVGLRTVTSTEARLGFADASCDPSISACELATTTSAITTSEVLARPTLGVRVELGDLIELGYQLQLDVEHPEASGHFATFGLRL